MSRNRLYSASLIGSLLLCLGILGTLLSPARAASADSARLPGYQGGSTPIPGGGVGTPVPGGTTTPTATPTPGMTITENIFHIISFPFEMMTEAVVNMSNKIIGQAYKDAQWIYGDTLGLLIFGDYGIAPDALGSSSLTPLFANIIQPHWNVIFTLTLLLLPATLALTAVEALRSSTTSVMGYADMKETLLGWFIAAGAAAASFYLLGLAHRMSLAAAQAILSADFGEQVSGQSLALAFFNTAAVAALASLVPIAPIALLYIGFLVLFLASSIILGLALALSAYTALVYMLSAIAPLIIILGVLRPMRWLHALWLKTITVVFLLPVADALLLKAAVSLVRSFYDPNGAGTSLGSFLAGLFVTGGVLSVLIAINFKVGEMVFGALGEIHRQAWGATMGVIQLAATAIGLVTGGIGIAAGGAGLAGAASGVGPMASGGGPTVGAGAATGMVAGTPSAAMGDTTTGVAQEGHVLAAERSTTADGRVASTLGTSLSFAQRTNDLLASGLFGKSTATHKARQSNPAASPAKEAEEQADTTPSSEGEGETEQIVSTTSDNSSAGQPSTPMQGQAAVSVMADTNPQGMIRRSRLAESFGRALAMTGNPTLRSFGVGLQVAGTVGEFTAGNLQDQSRAAISRTNEPSQTDSQLLDSAMRWSGRDLSTAPNELFDLGRDNTPIMAGALHQAFLSDPDVGRATSMRDVLNVVRDSYGQWQTQGQPGGVTAQRAYFETIADPGNSASPGRLTGAVVQWAEQYKVQLEPAWPDTVRTVFDQSQPVSGNSREASPRTGTR